MLEKINLVICLCYILNLKVKIDNLIFFLSDMSQEQTSVPREQNFDENIEDLKYQNQGTSISIPRN